MALQASEQPVALSVRRSHGGVELFALTAGPNTSVLDLLFEAQRRFDRSLVFRYSCRIGVCGSCPVRINGREGLACRTRALDAGTHILLEPLRHLPVVRDLAVDLAPYRAAGDALLPALQPSPAMMSATAPRAPAGDEAGGGTGDCITCAICYSASSNVDALSRYPGPSAFIRAASLISDPRDGGRTERLAAIEPWLHAPDDPEATALCPKGLRHAPALAALRAG
jgi:fumarate reductase iron-sulfur subunit